MTLIRTAASRISFLSKKHHLILLSFALPVVVLLIGYAFHGIFPFGSRSLLMIDLYHQYAPFLAELRNKLLSFSSIMFTWNGGLGTDFLPLYAYYLASPLNIFSIFFPPQFLTELVLFLVLVKVGLCGAFFAIYLKGVYRDSRLAIIAFASMYALSGYILGYSWNIMWLDCLYLLPLAVLGLVRLARGGNGILFCVSTALMLYSNFYAAFFGCAFLAMYFPVSLLQYNSIRKPSILLKISAKTAGYSLLAAGLSACLLVPTWFALKLTSATGDKMPKSLEEYKNLLDYLIPHLTFFEPTVREGMPNIYSGVIVLLLVPMYFMSRTISHKAKFLNGLLLVFLVSSFNINILNFLWHGMHFPNQLPFRNSYVYIFLVVSMAYPGYRSLREFSGKQIGFIAGILILTLVIYRKVSEPELSLFLFYSAIAFIMFHAGILTLHKRPGITHNLAALAFVLAVGIEISAHALVAVEQVDRRESYAGRNGYAAGAQVDDIREAVKIIEAGDRSFFRTEILPPRTTNDPFLYGFRGLSIFSSTFREKTVKSIERFGFHSNSINSYKYEGSTILIDSLFGIKYVIKRDDNITDDLRNKTHSTKFVTVYENPYALSLGFFIPEQEKVWRSSGTNPFSVQSSLLESMGFEDEIFEQVSISRAESENLTFESFGRSYVRYKRDSSSLSSTAKIRINTDKQGQYYFYLDIMANRADRGFVMIDDKRIDINAKRSTLVDLGNIGPENVVELNIIFAKTSPESGFFEIKTYLLNEENFKSAMEMASKSALIVDKYSSTHVSGHVNVSSAGTVVITTPFSEGWTVFVDGAKTETFAFDESLLSFVVSRGYHEIEMRFFTDKLPVSMAVSVFCFAILVLLFLQSRKKKRADL